MIAIGIIQIVIALIQLAIFLVILGMVSIALSKQNESKNMQGSGL